MPNLVDMSALPPGRRLPEIDRITTIYPPPFDIWDCGPIIYGSVWIPDSVLEDSMPDEDDHA